MKDSSESNNIIEQSLHSEGVINVCLGRQQQQQQTSVSTEESTISITSISSLSISQQKRRKAVRFPSDREQIEEVALYVPTRDELTLQEIKRTWYQKDEYKYFQNKARNIAKESKRYGYGLLIKNSFEGTKRNDKTQLDLDVWSQKYSLRGIEQWVNKQHGTERKDQRERYIRLILRTQDQMVKNYGEINDNTLYQVSQRFSNDARDFAHMLGKADEKAAEALYDHAGLTKNKLFLSPSIRQIPPSSTSSSSSSPIPSSIEMSSSSFSIGDNNNKSKLKNNNSNNINRNLNLSSTSTPVVMIRNSSPTSITSPITTPSTSSSSSLSSYKREIPYPSTERNNHQRLVSDCLQVPIRTTIILNKAETQ